MDIRIKYLGVYSALPTDAAIGCPHIIDMDSIDHDFYDHQNMTFADAVVTILYKFMPGALTAFLDLERPNFCYIQAGHPVGCLDFCIKRDERTVTVGFLNEKELGGWDEQHKYYIDGTATDKWTPISFFASDTYRTTNKNRMLAEASGRVYLFLMHEPWLADLPHQPVELICGLSDDRDFQRLGGFV